MGDRVVTLVPVDGVVLERLVAAATSGAAAGEVTPPVTAGDDWTPERVAWLRAFHLDRRAGLDGEAGEATWAVLLDGQAVGGVRLARVAKDDVLEAGVWLTRQVRGSGVGRAAVAALLDEAAALGAVAVRAETTAGNAAALAVLRQLGFECSDSGDGTVRAQVALREQ